MPRGAPRCGCPTWRARGPSGRASGPGRRPGPGGGGGGGPGGNGTRVPAVRRVVAELMGQEPYRSVDPDLVTALGAAIQAGVQSGAATRAVLLDVLPLSLGAETQGGLFS